MNVVHSPGAILAKPAGASIVQVETSRVLPWMILIVLIAGGAFGLSVATMLSVKDESAKMNDRIDWMSAYTEKRIAEQADTYRLAIDRIVSDGQHQNEMQTVAYRQKERETRLLQLKVDEFRMALIAAHIDPNPHVDGESK